MIREMAIALRAGLQQGFVTLTDIEQWADQVLQSDFPYEDWLGDLSTASQRGVPATYSTLGTVSGDWTPDELWTAFKELLGKKLTAGEITTREAVTVLVAQNRETPLPQLVADAVAAMSRDYEQGKTADADTGFSRLLRT